MNNKKILTIIFSVIGILLVVGGIFVLVNQPKEHESKKPKKEEKPKEEVKLPINDMSRFFDCTQETYQTDDYKVDYIYHFYFTNNVLQSGSLKYIYTFNSKGKYDEFSIDFEKIGMNVEEDSDETKLTKTYDTQVQYAQDTEGSKAIDDYIKKLESMKYSCKEIISES